MLSTTFCKMKMKNPTRLASGVLGVNAASLIRVAKEGAGAVTMKSVGPREREGHNNPTVIDLENGSMLNAVGLPTPGYRNMDEEMEELKVLKKMGVPLIGSVYGTVAAEFREVAEWMAKHKPDAIELDISCPNAEWEGNQFACDPALSTKIVSDVKDVAGKIPVIAKLTPQTHLVVEVGKACEGAGADALCMGNTMPAMSINIDARRPVLQNKKGGLSGAALKPINMKCVYELYEEVEIPIIGEGGISNGRDAIEYLQAGATIVGIGTAVRWRGTTVFREVCSEMQKWMKENGYKKVSDIVGVAHE